jgi:uncharacterized membrane protein YphA (DoxX/SURF4 family)
MTMKMIRSLSRVIVGIVFVFSGFVKAVDPLGSTYKFIDYFNAFGMEFLVPLAFPLAVVLSSIELVMGISLLLGYRMKLISRAVLLFMSFFTVLTFILAIYNPVTDCGCFGDAIILTNWQTFYKNIIFMVLTIIVFAGRKFFPCIRGAIAEWGILAFFFGGAIGLSGYCNNHLPILDFRPYNIGTHIPTASAIPEGAESDVYETHLFYRNISDGTIEEFTIQNFPQDSLWEFVDSKSVLISKGYEPPIHDFSISAPNGEDITESIKNYKGFVFLLISYNVSESDKEGLKKAEDYFKYSGIFNDVKFFAISASLYEDIRNVRDSLNLRYDFGTADEIALKTIIRSNPGLLLMKNGTILAKWHYNDFPEAVELGNEFSELITDYPFSRGVNLRTLNTPPEGSRSDLYKTSLLYRNILTDSVEHFGMDNFPKGGDYAFVSSNSEKIESGYNSPLENFKMITSEGTDEASGILQHEGDVFLISANEPQNLDPDILERLNRLSIVAASAPEEPVFFYGMTGLATDRLYGFSDSFISPITFYSSPAEFVRSVSGDGVSLIHIKNGFVVNRWDNNEIPGTEGFQNIIAESPEIKEFETHITPYVIGNYRSSIEGTRIYILILGFLFISLFIRVFFEDPFIKKQL